METNYGFNVPHEKPGHICSSYCMYYGSAPSAQKPMNTPDNWKEEFDAFLGPKLIILMPNVILDIKSFIESLLLSQKQELAEENKRLRECLEEAVHLMEDVRDGNYKPDSFTTQPWKNLLLTPLEK